jgi:cation:H+ antiporter
VFEVPIVIVISVSTWFFAADGYLEAFEGWILVAMMVVYTLWLIRSSSSEPASSQDAAATVIRKGTIVYLITVLAGLALLVLGARLLVAGATAMASALGVNDAVIGLTVVAAGTSMPEVAASIVAALRGHRDIAVGNVLGSNIFNLTIILGSTAVFAGGLAIPDGLIAFDLVVMVATAIACLPIFLTGHTIARWEGALFLAYYAAYTLHLVLDATGHERVPHFRDAMLFFAVPLTVTTLIVLVVRSLYRSGKHA